MTIRAVICDLMDVLILSGDQAGRRTYEARVGVAAGALERAMFDSPLFRDAIAGHIPAEALWRDVARVLGVAPGEWRAAADAFASAHTLNTELLAFLRALRPHYRTAILTNAPSDVRTWGIGRFDLERHVDLIVVSAEEGMHKPQRDVFLLAARRLGVRAEEAVFVDDDARYVAAARALGMCGIRFECTDQAIAAIRAVLEHA